MRSSRTRGRPAPHKTAAEIRSELRSILRARRDLYSPIERFEPTTDSDGKTRYYVLFDMHRRLRIEGLKLGGLNELKLPDEGIQDRVLEFAKAVWHLKDRLHQFARATNQAVDLDAVADRSMELLICADLANKKKHGRTGNRSKVSPVLDSVRFDTSRCGAIEFYYDGAMKYKELIVSNLAPIPFTVAILQEGTAAVLGDSLVTINQALCNWLPVIQQLGALSNEDPETAALKGILFPDDTPRLSKPNG